MYEVSLLKMGQLDVGVDRHNYSLAVTEVLGISYIYTECNCKGI